jgi:hypothetical protein
MSRIPLRNSIAYVGMLLGNFSAWWGFCTLPIYIVGFVLLHHGRGTGGPMTLPIEVPLIGLSLAVLGLLLAGGGRRETLPGVVGFVLNAVPMVLALMLWTLSGGA